MESERTQNFHDRLNQWVASQGFWFQLRYSMSGKGLHGSGIYHFMRLAARALVFLLIACAAGMVYLMKRADTDSFRGKLEASILSETGSKEGKMEGFQRMDGKLSIARFAARGGDGAFFTDVDLRDVGCRMGIFTGLFGPWKPGVITISKMDINLRAVKRGEAAETSPGDVLFKDRPDVEINGVDIEEATVSWGDTEFNRGLIRGSEVKVRRREFDWWIQLKGGTFSQNWLRGLEIEEIGISCSREGLRFEKGVLKNGGGTLDLTGLTVKGTSGQELEGTLKMKNLSIAGLLPVAAASILEVFISGELAVAGSVGSLEEIAFDGRVQMGEGDGLMIRDRLPLLKSLRAVDVFNNYRRVNFQTGSFRMKTGGGSLALTEVDLLAGDLMSLKGDLMVRRPTKEEKEKAGVVPGPAFFADKDEPVDASNDFTLKRAGRESRKKNPQDENGVMARYEIRLEERKFAEEMAASIAESLRYEGEFMVSLRPEAFDQSPTLKTEFPPDEGTGRIQLKVPVEGTLGTLTLKQADDLYTKGKR